jgi:uncharacterized membrane protein
LKVESRKSKTLADVLPWLLLVAGAIALLASIMLSIEVFDRLKNPNYVPACNLNPILSCTSVADSSQAHAFGFPNYFIGVAGYAVLTTVGVAMLAGAQFKRWFWLLVEVGLIFATANIKVHPRLKGTLAFAQRHHADILLVWFLIIILLILKRFWYYWSTLV